LGSHDRLSFGGGEYTTTGLTGVGEGYTIRITAGLEADDNYNPPVAAPGKTLVQDVIIASNIPDDLTSVGGGIGAITSVIADS